MRRSIAFVLNGEEVEVEVEDRATLLKVLRDHFGLTGPPNFRKKLLSIECGKGGVECLKEI